MNPKNHPNASVAVMTGYVATILVYLQDTVLHWNVPDYVSAAESTVLVAVALFLGRKYSGTPKTTRKRRTRKKVEVFDA